MRPPLEVLKCHIIGCYETSPRSTFDGHVANRHSPFHAQSTNGGAGVFKDVGRTTAHADPGKKRQDDVLRVKRHP
jgi:hypothetical protein